MEVYWSLYFRGKEEKVQTILQIIDVYSVDIH